MHTHARLIANFRQGHTRTYSGVHIRSGGVRLYTAVDIYSLDLVRSSGSFEIHPFLLISSRSTSARERTKKSRAARIAEKLRSRRVSEVLACSVTANHSSLVSFMYNRKVL